MDTSMDLGLVAQADPTATSRCRAIWIRWPWSPAGRRCVTRRRAILRAMRGRPFMFNLGHGIVPQTPLEHVAALVELVRAA